MASGGQYEQDQGSAAGSAGSGRVAGPGVPRSAARALRPQDGALRERSARDDDVSAIDDGLIGRSPTRCVGPAGWSWCGVGATAGWQFLPPGNQVVPSPTSVSSGNHLVIKQFPGGWRVVALNNRVRICSTNCDAAVQTAQITARRTAL